MLLRIRALAGAAQRSLSSGDGLPLALASGYAQLAVNFLVQILMVPIYLNALSRHSFGFLMTLLAFMTYAAIGVMWNSGGATRLLGEYHARRRWGHFASLHALSRRLNTAYAALIAFSCGALFLLFGSDQGMQPSERAAVVIVSGLYFVVSYSFSIDRIALAARGEQTVSNSFSILMQLVFVVVVVPLLYSGIGLVSVPLALLVGTGLAQIGVLRYVQTRWAPADALSVSDQRQIFRALFGRRGLGYMVYGVLALSLQADILIVGWFAGSEAVADYVIVWKIAEVAALMLWRIPDTMQPHFIHLHSRGEETRLRSSYYRTAWIVAVLAVAMGALYALVGAFAVQLWVGSEHVRADATTFALAGGALVWLALARPPIVLGFAMVALRPLLVIMALELAAKLTLMSLLFDRQGYLAPLIAVNVVHAVALFWAYQGMGVALARSMRSTSSIAALSPSHSDRC